jgi:menaquinone-dependent protoporphyrinogen oxidase
MLGEVRYFVKQYSEELADLPVAAFVVGFAPLSKEAGAVEQVMEILKSSLVPLHPVASTLFAGKLDEKKLNLVIRKFMETAKIPTGDFRDWDAICAWARDLPGKFGVC